MIKIPLDELSDGALKGVIDAYVLREGTDYGHRDIDIEEKRSKVRRMLETGKAQICYYPESDYIDIQLV